jgi:N utilization substance protein A
VDIVEWRDDAPSFIAEALSPAKVKEVRIEPPAADAEPGAQSTAVVIVPDHQLSLAIGKEGQNARLAARLSGYRVDIRSESEEAGVIPEEAPAAATEVAAAPAEETTPEEATPKESTPEKATTEEATPEEATTEDAAAGVNDAASGEKE